MKLYTVMQRSPEWEYSEGRDVEVNGPFAFSLDFDKAVLMATRMAEHDCCFPEIVSSVACSFPQGGFEVHKLDDPKFVYFVEENELDTFNLLNILKEGEWNENGTIGKTGRLVNQTVTVRV